MAAAARTHIIIPAGTYRISDTVTYGTGITWEFQQGASIAPDSTKTVTINGPVIAGDWQIASGSGTVVFGTRAVEQFARWPGTDLEKKIFACPVKINGITVTAGTAAPSTGTWAKGDLCLNSDPDSEEVIGWRCTAGASPGTWQEVKKQDAHIFFGTAAPVSGTYVAGDIVLHTDPAAAGDPIGWRCRNGGTPGDWDAINPSGTGSTYTVVESAEEAMDSGADTNRAVTVAHGLGSTPAAKDCVVSIYRSSGSGDFGIRGLWIKSTDSTNVTVNMYVSSLASSGTKAKIAVHIKTA